MLWFEVTAQAACKDLTQSLLPTFPTMFTVYRRLKDVGNGLNMLHWQWLLRVLNEVWVMDVFFLEMQWCCWSWPKWKTLQSRILDCRILFYRRSKCRYIKRWISAANKFVLLEHYCLISLMSEYTLHSTLVLVQMKLPTCKSWIIINTWCKWSTY